MSPAACPDVADCPDKLIYHDKCCNRCNMSINIKDQIKGKYKNNYIFYSLILLLYLRNAVLQPYQYFWQELIFFIDNCSLETCESIFVDANNTVGMMIVNHPLHGKCKNVDAIEGIKQCSGSCQSSTFFDSGNNTKSN